MSFSFFQAPTPLISAAYIWWVPLRRAVQQFLAYFYADGRQGHPDTGGPGRDVKLSFVLAADSEKNRPFRRSRSFTAYYSKATSDWPML
jgi:hypothetical protein